MGNELFCVLAQTQTDTLPKLPKFAGLLTNAAKKELWRMEPNMLNRLAAINASATAFL